MRQWTNGLQKHMQDSEATLKIALYDPYVKAVRWASNRIGKEGVVAFVTNNGFLDGFAFDGMRKHLAEDFDAIYILDLGGNVRKNPKLSGNAHNVFGIRVGVSINFSSREMSKQNQNLTRKPPKSSTHRVDEFMARNRSITFSIQSNTTKTLKWQQITPDSRYTWLTEGLHAEFDTFIPIGTKNSEGGQKGL